MPDLNPMSLMNAALGALVGAGTGGDTGSKARNDSDASDDFLKSSGPNFTDVMMARVSARQSTADDIQEAQKDYADKRVEGRSDEPVSPHVKQLKHVRANGKPAAKTDGAKADDPINDTRASAKTSAATDDADHVAATNETTTASAKKTTDVDAVIASSQQADWSDPQAVEGLKLVATGLLQAVQDGKLTVPPELKSILEKIAAADGTPGQILPLMQDMLGTLRKVELKTGDAALQAPAGEMTWPKEIADLFTKLQVNPGIKTGKAVDIGKIIKALRMLGHLVQQAGQNLKTADSVASVMAKAIAGEPLDHADIAVLKKAETATSSDEPTVLAANAAPTTPVVAPIAATPTEPTTDKAVFGASQAMLHGTPATTPGQPASADHDNGGDTLPRPTAGISAAAATPKPAAPVVTAPVELATPDDKNAAGLTPLASAMSARSVFTAGINPGGAANPTIPHPATQQVMVTLQKSPITKDTQLSLQLNPAELGRVDVKITIDQTGKASAQIMAERPETLALLQKDTSHLEKALQAAGLNSSAQDLHYSLKEQNGRQNGQEFSQKRRRALFDSDEDMKTVAIDSNVYSNDGLNHRVNYHA